MYTYIYERVISKVGIIINKSYNGYTYKILYDVYNTTSHKNRYSTAAAVAELPIQS